MPRPKRKKLKFTEDSMNELLQEIYNDTHITRATIKRLFTKWETKIKENGDLAVLGKDVTNLLNSELRNQEQKIKILQFLNDVLARKEENGENGKEGKESNSKLNSDDRKKLMEMLRNEREKEEKND